MLSPSLYKQAWVASKSCPSPISAMSQPLTPTPLFAPSPSLSPPVPAQRYSPALNSDSLTDVENSQEEWVGGVLRRRYPRRTSPASPNSIEQGRPMHFSSPSSPVEASQGSIHSFPASRASSRASSRGGRGGRVTVDEVPRGAIRADEAVLPSMNSLDTRRAGFRFTSKTYWLTWSQIGDLPNSALEDLITTFGNKIKDKCLETVFWKASLLTYCFTLDGSRRTSSGWWKALACVHCLP